MKKPKEPVRHKHPKHAEKDPIMQEIGDILCASKRVDEFKGLQPGTSLTLTASGRLYGADGTTVNVVIVKGTPKPKPEEDDDDGTE